jgi:hypothetical protein
MLLAESITLGGVFRAIGCFLYNNFRLTINQRAIAHFSTNIGSFCMDRSFLFQNTAPNRKIRQQAVDPKIEKTALHKV